MSSLLWLQAYIFSLFAWLQAQTFDLDEFLAGPGLETTVWIVVWVGAVILALQALTWATKTTDAATVWIERLVNSLVVVGALMVGMACALAIVHAPILKVGLVLALVLYAGAATVIAAASVAAIIGIALRAVVRRSV